jgi:hypothetical protein
VPAAVADGAKLLMLLVDLPACSDVDEESNKNDDPVSKSLVSSLLR